EAWYRVDDGAVFPLAPGVRAAGDDGAAYGFRNFSVDEVVGELEALLQRLARVNANARVVLTVSPVPLVATCEPRHVLVSSTASKAILRAAVDEIVRRHAEVAYFPSYEIVTGAFNRGAYFGTDLRSPTAEGIDHVMRVFFAHCADGTPRPAPNIRLSDEIARDMDVVCDEDLLARS
ncbi:MAG: GSCFA domain-containing protein, partial [Candidatus Eremiobacteraeota bacterium]|nr:GSCFA domain-containing protein [Candidatus Eremiobacteraeota bacterium]